MAGAEMKGALQQIQLIDGEGNYNLTGIETFARKVKLADCGLSYAVIAIMGPQSSGTLLTFAQNVLHVTRLMQGDACISVEGFIMFQWFAEGCVLLF